MVVKGGCNISTKMWISRGRPNRLTERKGVELDKWCEGCTCDWTDQ